MNTQQALPENWKEAIKLLDKIREDRGFTHEQIGEMISKQRSEITRFFSRKNKPGIDVFYMIIGALQIKLSFQFETVEAEAEKPGQQETITLNVGKKLQTGDIIKVVDLAVRSPNAKKIPALQLVIIPPEAMKASAKYKRIAPNLYKWENEVEVYRAKKYMGAVVGFVDEHFLNRDRAEEFLSNL